MSKKTNKDLQARIAELEAEVDKNSEKLEEQETVVPVERKKYIKDIGIGITSRSLISKFTERRQ